MTITAAKLLNKSNKDINEDKKRLESLFKEGESNIDEIDKLKTKIKEFHKKEMEGQRIRAKIQNYEENEKPTKFFFF